MTFNETKTRLLSLTSLAAKSLACAIAILSLVSCEGDCVCGFPMAPADGYGYFDARANWKLFPQETPTGWTLMLFPEDSSESSRFISADVERIGCNVRPGRYSAVAFNQTVREFGHIVFSVGRLEECLAFGWKLEAPNWAKVEESLFIEEPDWLASAKADGVNVAADAFIRQECPCAEHPLEECCCPDPGKCSCCKNENAVNRVLPMDMECRIELVRIHVDCPWSERVKSAIACLSGLAEGFDLNLGQCFGRAGQILPEWSIDRSGGESLDSEIRTFGFDLGDGRAEWGRLKLLLANEAGRAYSCVFPIGEDNAVWDKKAHVIDIHLRIDGEFPFDGDGDVSGWMIGVGEWGPEKEIDL